MRTRWMYAFALLSLFAFVAGCGGGGGGGGPSESRADTVDKLTNTNSETGQPSATSQLKQDKAEFSSAQLAGTWTTYYYFEEGCNEEIYEEGYLGEATVTYVGGNTYNVYGGDDENGDPVTQPFTYDAADGVLDLNAPFSYAEDGGTTTISEMVMWTGSYQDEDGNEVLFVIGYDIWSWSDGTESCSGWSCWYAEKD